MHVSTSNLATGEWHQGLLKVFIQLSLDMVLEEAYMECSPKSRSALHHNVLLSKSLVAGMHFLHLCKRMRQVTKQTFASRAIAVSFRNRKCSSHWTLSQRIKQVMSKHAHKQTRLQMLYLCMICQADGKNLGCRVSVKDCLNLCISTRSESEPPSASAAATTCLPCHACPFVASSDTSWLLTPCCCRDSC